MNVIDTGRHLSGCGAVGRGLEPLHFTRRDRGGAEREAARVFPPAVLRPERGAPRGARKRRRRGSPRPSPTGALTSASEAERPPSKEKTRGSGTDRKDPYRALQGPGVRVSARAPRGEEVQGRREAGFDAGEGSGVTRGPGVEGCGGRVFGSPVPVARLNIPLSDGGGVRAGEVDQARETATFPVGLRGPPGPPPRPRR